MQSTKRSSYKYARFLTLAITIVIAFSVIAISPSVALAGQDKVTVCHKPGTDAEQTLTFAAPAEKAHLDHGDTQGECTGPQSEGCAALNEVIPDKQTVPGSYIFIVSDLDFLPDEVIHADITITIVGGTVFMIPEVRNSFDIVIAGEFLIISGPATETASTEYTVVAGDDADSVGVAAASGGAEFTVTEVNISCTPAP